MDGKHVTTTVEDLETGVIYKIKSYRPITKREAAIAVAMHQAGRKRKPKRGSQVTVITQFGLHD